MKRKTYEPLSLPDSFESALDRRPADWALRLVAADWLEENGDPFGAECLRWQARHRKRPDRNRWYEPDGLWAWWVLFPPDAWNPERPRCRNVPEPLWNKLPPRVDWFAGYRAYPSRAAAEYALRVAWGRLTPRQRERVWDWPQAAAPRKRHADGWR
jgi:uncharacterized protein (TIGR02996 family)